MPSPPLDKNYSLPRAWWPALFAALAYFLVSVLLTWPVVLRVDSVLFGDYGDTRGTAWWVWAKSNSWLEAQVNFHLAAPFGLPTVQVFSQPVAERMLLIIARFSNEIAAMNCFVLLSFPLTAIATYFLLGRLLRNRTAAFVGGLIFGFCPAAVTQATGGHTSFAFNMFIPLFLLALFYNRSRRTVLSAVSVAASFAGIAFTTLYLGYFALYIALFFVAFDFLTRETDDVRGIARNYLYCAAFAALITIPVEFMAILEQLSSSPKTIAKAGHIRDFSELGVFASRFWNYLIPSIDHPVLGAYFEDFVRNNLHGSNVFEQTLYLGLVPLGLLLAGVVIAVSGKFEADHRRYFRFFAIGGLWMYFLSLPPKIAGGIPSVSYFAHEFAPMFRVYARFGILVNLFVACAAAVVLAHLYQRMKRLQYYALLGVLLPMLVFEYWSVPPGYALAVDQPPEVYRWLSEQTGDFIVAEYPMIRSDEAAFYTYPFWQRIHKKRLVNGASPDNPRAWALFEGVKDLANPETPALLKSAGVKYVIIHKRMYQEGPIPEPIKRYYGPERAALTENGGKVPAIPASLKFVKAFGSDAIFTLHDATQLGEFQTNGAASRPGAL